MREGEEEADAQTKKIRTTIAEEVAEKEEMSETKIDMEAKEAVDAEMHDESAEGSTDVVMTLGQVLFEISKIDPVIQKWTDRVAKENEDVDSASGCGPGAALSSAGTPFLGQVDVAEVYSPPRVTSMARKWDFMLDPQWISEQGLTLPAEQIGKKQGKGSRRRDHACWWDHQNALCSPPYSSYLPGRSKKRRNCTKPKPI